MLTFLQRIALVLVCGSAIGAAPTTAPSTQPARTVRVAVIGGMTDTGFWDALAKRFETESGIKVIVVASGNKDGISVVYKQGGIDLITMHASDTIINLVADGWASDPQPWAKNDFAIIGPPDDPAHIKGMTDAAEALVKIVDSRSEFIVHSSLGAQEVLRELLTIADYSLDPDHTTQLLEDRQRRIMRTVAEKKGYTIVGRIPFLSGKIPNEGMQIMVAGDPRLRRPFVVCVANPAKVNGAHLAEARRLADFLRDPQAQQWISEYGKDKFDGRPLFFPVENLKLPRGPATHPADDAVLRIDGLVERPLAIDANALSKLERHEVRPTDHNGTSATYSGYRLRDVLKLAGVPIGDHKMRGEMMSRIVLAEALDGYRVAFSLAELDPDFGERDILLVDARNGAPIAETRGTFSIIVPRETRRARWVKQVVSLRIVDADR